MNRHVANGAYRTRLAIHPGPSTRTWPTARQAFWWPHDRAHRTIGQAHGRGAILTAFYVFVALVVVIPVTSAATLFYVAVRAIWLLTANILGTIAVLAGWSNVDNLDRELATLRQPTHKSLQRAHSGPQLAYSGPQREHNGPQRTYDYQDLRPRPRGYALVRFGLLLAVATGLVGAAIIWGLTVVSLAGGTPPPTTDELITGIHARTEQRQTYYATRMEDQAP